MKEYQLTYDMEQFELDQQLRNALQSVDAHPVGSGTDFIYRDLWVQFADHIDPKVVLKAATAVVEVVDFKEVELS